jgi:hypothetical protein
MLAVISKTPVLIGIKAEDFGIKYWQSNEIIFWGIDRSTAEHRVESFYN